MSRSRIPHQFLPSNSPLSRRRSRRRSRSTGPKAASMTSGRGRPSTGRDHQHAASASVMDGHFVAIGGGVR